MLSNIRISLFLRSDRCNTELDCADETDEQYCDYLSFGSNYAKESVPRDEFGTPLIVYMNVSGKNDFINLINYY